MNDTLIVTSPAFENKGKIPIQNTGRGADISPRLLLLVLLFGGIGLIILLLTRKLRRGFFIAFLSYIIVSATLGIILPISLPAGSEVVTKDPNAAYSLKSTSQDIGLFAQELLTTYHSEDSILQELFKPQVAVDESNSWGAGLAIEKTDKSLTYWHSGINPGTYKVEDVAEILNIGRTSAYTLVKEGHFKTVRIGTAIRISKKSFDDWLDRQEF